MHTLNNLKHSFIEKASITTSDIGKKLWSELLVNIKFVIHTENVNYWGVTFWMMSTQSQQLQQIKHVFTEVFQQVMVFRQVSMSMCEYVVT